jgi:MFS transporter, DHA1 family, tetracycline resistance protein
LHKQTIPIFMLPSNQKRSFPVLLLITFLNTLGIGIFIPILPFLVAKYVGNDPETIALYAGIIVSLYAFCEFFAAPMMGILSDKYGRRPVIIYSLIGSAIGYWMLGFGGSLWMLFAGRIIDGITAGEISAIFAYVGDITKPEERGAKFGVLGGTLGAGFMVGPAIGGFLANWGLSAPMYVAAGITLLSAVWAQFSLPESLKKEDRITDFSIKDLNPFGIFGSIGSKLFLRTILFASAFHFIAFAQLQGNGSILFKDALSWSPSDIGVAFLIIGLVDIATQAFLIEKLLPTFGERKLSIIGLIFTFVAYLFFAYLPQSHSSIMAYIAVFLFSFGSGLFEPCMANMVSQSGNESEQGKVQGAYQALESLTRIIGPITAAFLYQWNWSSPYIVNIFLTLISIVFFYKLKIFAYKTI